MTVDWTTVVAVIGLVIATAGILFGFYEWRRSLKLARTGRVPSVISSIQFTGFAIAMVNTETWDVVVPGPPKELFDVHHSVKIENVGETPALNVVVFSKINRCDGPSFDWRLLNGKEKVILFHLPALSPLEPVAQKALADDDGPLLILKIQYQDTEGCGHSRVDRFKYSREEHEWLVFSGPEH